MDRAFSQDDRIRRAEEIYARRRNLREKTKKATLSVSTEPKNFKLFKRLALQIVICILIYYIFHLIDTTNYSFSGDTLSKAKEIISYDFDFYNAYNEVIENINKFLYSEENKAELEKNEDEANENQAQDEESVNQSEVKFTEESETERIKNNYSFILPVTGVVSSEFGEREVTSDVITAYHKGIDLVADTGNSILSATDGEVVISKYSPSYGNYAIIQNNEVKTVYAHCSELLVNVRRQSDPRTRNCKDRSNRGSDRSTFAL